MYSTQILLNTYDYGYDMDWPPREVEKKSEIGMGSRIKSLGSLATGQQQQQQQQGGKGNRGTKRDRIGPSK